MRLRYLEFINFDFWLYPFNANNSKLEYHIYLQQKQTNCFSDVDTILFLSGGVFLFVCLLSIKSFDSTETAYWQSSLRWLIKFFLSFRWVPLSRWGQIRHTTVSSWTSQDPAALHPFLETWAQAWMHPTWAGLQWEWTNPGAKAWGLLGHTVKECLSKAMQVLGLRAWVCKA